MHVYYTHNISAKGRGTDTWYHHIVQTYTHTCTMCVYKLPTKLCYCSTIYAHVVHAHMQRRLHNHPCLYLYVCMMCAHILSLSLSLSQTITIHACFYLYGCIYVCARALTGRNHHPCLYMYGCMYVHVCVYSRSLSHTHTRRPQPSMLTS